MVVESKSELVDLVEDGWSVEISTVSPQYQGSLGRISVQLWRGKGTENQRSIYVYGNSVTECASRALTEARECDGSCTWILPDYRNPHLR